MLTKEELGVVLKLIAVAWGAGAVRSPEDGANLDALKVKVAKLIGPQPEADERKA